MKHVDYTGDKVGQFPLHYCISIQKSEFSKEIIPAYQQQIIGRNLSYYLNEFVNKQDEYGFTPMHIFAMFNAQDSDYLTNATYLKEKGADLNAKNKDGNTPLHIWVYQYEEVTSGVENSFVEEARKLPQNFLKHSMPFIGWMLENGYNPRARNNEGYTALELLERVAPQGVKIDEKTLKDAYRYWERNGNVKELTYTKDKDGCGCVMM